MEQTEIKNYAKKLIAIANILDKYDEKFIETLKPEDVFDIVAKEKKAKANT